MNTSSLRIALLCSLLALPLFSSAAPASGEPNSKRNAASAASTQAINTAINKAGRQRMLSQRMGKAYAMMGLSVEPQMAANIMTQSQNLFAQQLAELKTITPSDEIASSITLLEQAWNAYKGDLALPVNKENARRVYASGDLTLKRANELTLLYEKQLGTSQGHLVNVAGRQRMLSQRVARAYFFKKWGVAVDAAKDLDQALTEFKTGMDKLKSAMENTGKIKEALLLADQQWMFFQRAIDNASSTSPDPAVALRNLATTSERILEQMNEVTAQYENIGGK